MKMTVKEIKAVIADKIPDGLVVPEHTAFGHFYRHTPSNQVWASVTTQSGILDSPHLKQWAAGMAVTYIGDRLHQITPENKDDIFTAAIQSHRDYFEEAGDIGTRGHKVVEDWMEDWIENGKMGEATDFLPDGIAGDDARLWAISRSAQQFCEDYEVVPIATELNVCSLKYGFAGQLDALGMVKINGKMEFCLIDWKTSNSIDKPDYAMQVSAYRQGLVELTGLKPKYLIIVRLDKKQCKYEVRKVANHVKAFKAFKEVCKVSAWLKSEGDKVVPLVAKERINIFE